MMMNNVFIFVKLDNRDLSQNVALHKQVFIKLYLFS